MPPSTKLENVTVVPGMSPFVQRTKSLPRQQSATNVSDTDSESGGKFNKVIRDAESNVARLAGAMHDAELELEKAFSRTGLVQKGYASKLDLQLEELKGILGSKQAQIAFLEDKVGNLKESYGEKLSKAQAKVASLEQEQRRTKHSQALERTRLSEKVQGDLSSLQVQVRQLKKSKAVLESRVEKLTIENGVLKKKGSVSNASVFEFDVNRVSKLEKEMRECKQHLQLEKARNAKLQKNIQRLEEESRKVRARRAGQ